ncbi:MAG: hypothetical protein ABIZ80_05340 [Bryobacteraceae bacterium]
MRKALSVVGLLLATLIFLVTLYVVDPFQAARKVLTAGFGAGPEWTQVEQVFLNPETQETTKGEQPLVSFAKLAETWSRNPDAKRICLLGNSQMLATVLAPGEQLVNQPEKTYPDFLYEHYRKPGEPGLNLYRLAAPNLSYMEALWYLYYLLESPNLKPDGIVLQLNYESFRKTGIRDGMLSMLADERFAGRMRQVTAREKPYAGVFEQAIRRYQDRQAEVSASKTSHTGLQAGLGFGHLLELAVRGILGNVPRYKDRHEVKYSLVQLLYLSRVYLLHLKPTTPRSIGGAALDLSRGSVEEIASLCRDRNIRLVLLNAAQNPLAPLYKTENDRRRYSDVIHQLADSYHLKLYDFENSIPAQYWGVWVDGPDPIHFGRAGHHMMANLIIQSSVVAPSVN